MFDNIKMMTALAGLMKNKDKLASAAARVKERAGTIRAAGQGGGGAVRATVDGTMKVHAVEFSAALAAGMAADETTRAAAGSLVAEAVSQAQRGAQDQMRELIEGELRALGMGDVLRDLPMIGDLLGPGGIGGGAR